MRGLGEFFEGRMRDAALIALLRKRMPRVPDVDLRRVMESERELERQFERRARERWARELPRILSLPEPARSREMRAFADRERRYAAMREQAMVNRAVRRAERERLRRESPEGAYWALSRDVREHTLDCLAMADRFWPWEVLDRVHPALHPGCQCRLVSLGQAVRRGLMSRRDVPEVGEAVRLASRLSRDVPELRAALSEAGVGEREAVQLGLAERHLELREAAGRPWERRWPKGTPKAGEFRPRRGGSPGTRRVRKARSLLRRLNRRAPFERSPGDRRGEVAQRVRGGRNPLPVNSPVSHLDDLAGLGWRVTARTDEPGTGHEVVALRDDRSGRSLVVTHDGAKVRASEFDPGERGVAALRSPGPPTSWRAFRADALALADELAKKHKTTAMATDFEEDPGLTDTAGRRTWEGVTEVGPDARSAVEAMAAARKAGRPLEDSQLEDYWIAAEVQAHEIGHAVNPLPQRLFVDDVERLAEEGLTEEVARQVAARRLEDQGQLDVLRWMAANPFNVNVEGNYVEQRLAWTSILDRIGVPPEERRDYLERLKFEVPPEERIATVARGVAGPGGDVARAEEWVRNLFLGRAELAHEFALPLVPAGAAEHRDEPRLEMGAGNVLEQGSQVRLKRGLFGGERLGEVANVIHERDGTYSARVRTADGTTVVTGVLPGELPDGVEFARNAEVRLPDGTPVREGDVVSYDRLDGSRTRARVSRVSRAGEGADWTLEATVKGRRVVLTPQSAPRLRREGSTPQSPGRVPVAPPLRDRLPDVGVAVRDREPLSPGRRPADPGEAVKVITDGAVVRYGTWDAAADALVDARARGQSVEIAVLPRRGSQQERRMTADEQAYVLELAAQRIMRGEPESPGRRESLTDVLARHADIELYASEGDRGIVLSLVRVPDAERGKGKASAAMRDVLAYADATGQRVGLTPERMGAGGLSKAELTSWYRNLGFVPNRGRNKDFAFSETMVREPRRPLVFGAQSPGRRFVDPYATSRAPTRPESPLMGRPRFVVPDRFDVPGTERPLGGGRVADPPSRFDAPGTRPPLSGAELDEVTAARAAFDRDASTENAMRLDRALSAAPASPGRRLPTSGRYLLRSDPGRDSDELTQLVRAAKTDRGRDGEVARRLEGVAREQGYPAPDLVVSLPPDPGDPDRFGGVRARLAADLGGAPAPTGVLRERYDVPGYRGMSARERLARSGLDRFEVADPDAVRGRRVLLVDDVVTSGAQARSAIAALEGAGATVDFAALAQAPSLPDRPLPFLASPGRRELPLPAFPRGKGKAEDVVVPLFHVAPRSARASIERYGLDAERAKVRPWVDRASVDVSRVGSERFGGTFFYADPEDAAGYGEAMQRGPGNDTGLWDDGFDLWEVPPRQVPAYTDPETGGKAYPFKSLSDGGGGRWWTPGAVPAESVRRVSEEQAEDDFLGYVPMPDGLASPGRRGGLGREHAEAEQLRDLPLPDGLRTEQDMVEMYEGDYAGFEVAVENTIPGAGRIYAEGPVLDAKGKDVGHWGRTIRRDRGGNLVAYHEHLTLAPEAQRRGFATAWNAHEEARLRELGVDRIELQTRGDGSLVWAKAGYRYEPVWAAQVLQRELPAPADVPALDDVVAERTRVWPGSVLERALGASAARVELLGEARIGLPAGVDESRVLSPEDAVRAIELDAAGDRAAAEALLEGKIDSPREVVSLLPEEQVVSSGWRGVRWLHTRDWRQDLRTKLDHRNVPEAAYRYEWHDAGDDVDMSRGLSAAVNTHRRVKVTLEDGTVFEGRMSGDLDTGDLTVYGEKPSAAPFSPWDVTTLEVAADDVPELSLDADVRQARDEASAARYMRGLGLDADLSGLEWEPRAFAEIAQATKDAMARFPVLRDGGSGHGRLVGVRSAPAVRGLAAEAREVAAKAEVWAVTGPAPAMLPDPERTDGPTIVLSAPTAAAVREVAAEMGVPPSEMEMDTPAMAAGLVGGTAHADRRPYGRMMHELGHALAQTWGISYSDRDEGALLTEVGLSPREMSRVSSYGSSSSPEAFAEAFTTVYSPGELERLPPDLQAKLRRFRELLESWGDGGS